MSDITLAMQIEAQERFVRTCDLGRLEMGNAILASLRRLQEIEQQEPVATMSVSGFSVGIMYGVTPLPPSGEYKLYLDPVSPEGFKLVPIEPTEEILNVLYDCPKYDADDEHLKATWAKIIEASEVNHD